MSDCVAKESVICPTDLVMAPQGEADLNLTQTNIIVDGIDNSPSFVISSSNPNGPMGISDASGSTVCVPSFNFDYEIMNFVVGATGDYLFSNILGGGFAAVSIFDADGFNPASPCSSTFYGSNGYINAPVSASGSFTASLEDCTEYVMIVYDDSNYNPSICCKFK